MEGFSGSKGREASRLGITAVDYSQDPKQATVGHHTSTILIFIAVSPGASPHSAFNGTQALWPVDHLSGPLWP